jgi:hypothetical protein
VAAREGDGVIDGCAAVYLLSSSSTMRYAVRSRGNYSFWLPSTYRCFGIVENLKFIFRCFKKLSNEILKVANDMSH